MEAYSKFTNNSHTLKILNNCRTYLKIITLSDISSTDGKTLIPTQLNGHQSPSFTSHLVWQRQKKTKRAGIFLKISQYIF